jgi:WD40 repeat protein/serine/threonine protein kinase
MITCPGREQLDRFLADELPPAKVSEIETHVENCTACRESLAHLSQLSSVLEYPQQVAKSQSSSSISPEFLARMKNRQFQVSDRTKSAPPSGSVPGQIAVNTTLPSVPGYEVLAEIGRGGMGVVYKARHLGLKRLVALKMLLGSGFESHDSRQRFRREAQSIGRLQHPNVVQVYDFGETDAGPFFSLELLESGSLARRLDGNPWNPDAAARFVERLAWAIQFAHEQGVIHRDLKPANILLQSGTGEKPLESATHSADSSIKIHPALYVPKITDFGLAKCLDEDQQQTANGAILGTPSYLAPEQADSKLGAVGPATDVYGLGAILYELLTGSPPFRGDSIMSTLLLVTHQEPVRPSRLNPKIPRDLETICLKCLHKSPAKRFASASLLAEDLHRFLAGEPVLARPVGGMEKAWRACRRNPLIATLLSSIMLVAFVGFAGTAWAWRSAKDGWNRAETALSREITANQELAEQTARTEDALYVRKLALAHHEWLGFNVRRANELLAECPVEQRSWEWQYLHRICNDEVLSLKGNKYPVRSVAFSPDGKRIATGTGRWPIDVLSPLPSAIEPGEARIWDAETGVEILNLRGHQAAVMGVTFSPDGRFVATASFDQTARMWDAKTGKELFVLKSSSSWVHSVAFSPDSSRLASSNAGAIQIWDTSTGQETLTLSGNADSIFSVAFTPDGRRLVSGGRDSTIKVWDIQSAVGRDVSTPLLTIIGPLDVRRIAISPDGRRIVAGGYNGRVKVFDLVSGAEIVTQYGHPTNVAGVAYSPDGRTIVSTDFEGRVLMWDAETTDHLRVIRGHAGGVYSVAFRSDGRHLATGGADGTVKIWDVTTDQAFRELSPKGGWLRHLAFSPDSRHVAAAGPMSSRGQQPFARIWNLSTPSSQQTLMAHRKGVTSTAFTFDGTHFVTGSADHTAKIWHVRDGKNVKTLRGHTDTVTTVACSSDGRWIASGSADKTIRVWKVTTLDAGTSALLPSLAAALPASMVSTLPSTIEAVPHLTLKNQKTGVTTIALSPNNRWLASGDLGGTIRLWDVMTGKELLVLPDLPGPVASLAFDPHSMQLAAACYDKYPRVWELKDLASEGLSVSEARLFRGHVDQVFSVAFNADGRRLASASSDATVRLWDVSSGQETLALRAPVQGQAAVAFSPDGRTLSAGSEAVILWESVRPDRNTAEWIEAWHRAEFDRAKTDLLWFTASYHLSRLLDFQPGTSNLYLERADLRLFQREWALAAADFSQYFRRQPTHLALQFRQAAAFLLAGDEPSYHTLCNAMLAKHGQTRDALQAYYLIRLCTLLPQAPETVERLRRLTEDVLTSRTKAPAELHTVAIACYRAGRYAECNTAARASLAAEPQWQSREINHLVLAMSLHKLGQTDEALREFKSFVAWAEKAEALPKSQSRHTLGIHPSDWLTILILRKEAESALGIAGE